MLKGHTPHFDEKDRCRHETSLLSALINDMSGFPFLSVKENFGRGYCRVLVGCTVLPGGSDHETDIQHAIRHWRCMNGITEYLNYYYC